MLKKDKNGRFVKTLKEKKCLFCKQKFKPVCIKNKYCSKQCYWNHLKITRKGYPNYYKGKHKMSGTKFYSKWVAMISRCKYKRYKYWYGRGIKVCKEWQDFLNFKEDMYESYLSHVEEFGEKQTTLDRIDNDGNYEPSNCKWSTWKEQNNNQQKTLCKKNL